MVANLGWDTHILKKLVFYYDFQQFCFNQRMNQQPTYTYCHKSKFCFKMGSALLYLIQVPKPQTTQSVAFKNQFLWTTLELVPFPHPPKAIFTVAIALNISIQKMSTTAATGIH